MNRREKYELRRRKRIKRKKRLKVYFLVISMIGIIISSATIKKRADDKMGIETEIGLKIENIKIFSK